MRLTKLAKEQLSKFLQPGDSAIDATVGNGQDTVFLAMQVGLSGLIHGFDIQNDALINARQLIEKQAPESNVELYLAGHEKMDKHLPDNMRLNSAAAVFNLGYLPGGNKSVTTRTNTTLMALDLAWAKYLKPRGMLSILCYPGHPGGQEETEAVGDWLIKINAKVITTRSLGPVLHLVQK